MKGMTLSRVGEGALLLLVALGILWKGGKTLEMTWLLAGLAAVLAILSLFPRIFRTSQADDARKGDLHFALWIPLLSFVLWSVASYALSETRNYGLDEILRDASCVLLFLWLTRWLSSGKGDSFVPSLLRLVTVVSAVASLVGCAVYALEPVDRFVGTFFDIRFDTDFWPNAWGEYLLLAWPLVMLQAIYHRKKKTSWMYSLVGGLMAGGLLLSYSRGSILSFGVQAVVLTALSCFLLWRDIRYRQGFGAEVKLLVTHAGAAALLAVALFFGVNAARSVHFPVQSVAEKVTFTAEEGRSSIDERAQFWGQALKAASEKPLFGYGPYSFRFVQTKDAQGVLATSDHPHNVFLKLAMERGWPAAILFLLVLAGVAYSSLRKVLYERRSDWSFEKDCQALLLGTAVVGVMVHNLIDYNLQFVGIALPFWIVLACLYAPAALSQETAAPSFRRWKCGRILLHAEFLIAIALLAVTVTEGAYLITSSFARHADAAGQTEEALLWYGRSERELFGRDLFLAKAVILMDAGRHAEAADALGAYVRENAHDARVWKLMGILALKEEDPVLAFANIQKAYDLGKMTDLGITTLYLESAVAGDQVETIVTQKKDVDALFMAYADAIGENAHFIALSRNVEELQTVARLLGRVFPADAERYRSIAAKAADHAATERARLSSRTPGILW